jgi:hypothetical protein
MENNSSLALAKYVQNTGDQRENQVPSPDE